MTAGTEKNPASAGGPRSFEEVQPERAGGHILLVNLTPLWGEGFPQECRHVGSGDLAITHMLLLNSTYGVIVNAPVHNISISRLREFNTCSSRKI